MNLALSPFLGRWGWPFGPPKRHPLLIAFGAPIEVPSNKAGEKPGAEVVDKYHTKLVVSSDCEHTLGVSGRN